MKQKSQLLFKSFILIILIILTNSIANSLEGIWHYVFYHGIYCLGISICVPLFLFSREENCDLTQLGIKKLRRIDYIIIIGFVIFSIGGQLVNIKLENINWKVLPLSILPLLLTTFSEELFFRGFIQTRFAKMFGAIPAIIFSGLLFSLYHLGYPRFRSVQWIILLIFVGIMFALSYTLSNYNLTVAYFVNLPNAYLTYLLNYQKFPQLNFDKTASVASVLIIFVTAFIFYRGFKYKKAIIMRTTR